jgi:hypothetical protein
MLELIIGNTDQLDIIDRESKLEANIYQIGDKVKIRKIEKANNELDSEDYFYLKSFENKTGIISEITNNSTGTNSYRVEFNETSFGYFYEKDME